MTTKETNTPTTSINFHFDPACPLAWRTALWIREVRKVRPVDITWRLFSLEVVNRKEGTEPDYQNGGSWAALRTLALQGGKAGKGALESLIFPWELDSMGGKEVLNTSSFYEKLSKRAIPILLLS